MTTSEIQERNKQIALMLGAYEITEWFKTDLDSIPYYKGTCYYLGRPNNNWSCGSSNKEEVEKSLLNTLQFHSDWNWLMEAIEFIEKKGYTISITGKFVNIMFVEENIGKSISSRYGYTKIEAVFLAVSDFAKFYNEGEL